MKESEEIMIILVDLYDTSIRPILTYWVGNLDIDHGRNERTQNI
jgi:hypothetical protein